MAGAGRSIGARSRVVEGISRQPRAARSIAGLQHVPPVKTRNSKSEIRVNEIRERLKGKRGQEYWRSLEEVAVTPEFREVAQREFPAGASEWLDDFSRRNFLKFAAASLALAGLTSCTKQPPHEILPYVRQPEGLVPGEPLFY